MNGRHRGSTRREREMVAAEQRARRPEPDLGFVELIVQQNRQAVEYGRRLAEQRRTAEANARTLANLCGVRYRPERPA